MKVALSTVCLPELPWREALAEAAKDGYEGLELLVIPGFVHMVAGEVPAQEVADEARRLGLNIIGLHAGGLDGASDEKIAETLAYLDSVVRYAEEMGVPMVNLNGMPYPHNAAPEVRRAEVARIAHALRDYAPTLEGRPVRLTLENHCGCQIEQPEDYRDIFHALPPGAKVGATVDTGHFHAAHVDMAPLIREFGPRVFHVHMKDHVGYESVALGKGETDNAAVIAALREIGYDGWVSVELEVHDRENAQRYAAEGRAYVEGLLGGANG